MSSTRNKRKRPESDTVGVATPPSRRRSRDQRAVGPEIAQTTSSSASTAVSSRGPSTKNDEGSDDSMRVEGDAGAGDSAKSVPSMTKQDGKDTSHGSSAQVSDEKATGDADETPVSKVRKKSDLNGLNKSLSNESALLTSKESVEAPLSSMDAVSSTTDTQDGTSSRRQALHVANEEASKLEARGSNNDDASRIRELITHRSMLLERVRICKDAAEKRLRGLSKSRGGRQLTDEEEIAAFRSKAKQASLAVKRSRGDGNPESRTSLSLRRGSSVGKRMNAAISSLVPGSNISSATVLEDHKSQSLAESANPPTQITMSKYPTTAAATTTAASTQQKTALIPIAPGISPFTPSTVMPMGFSHPQGPTGQSKLKKASTQSDVPRGRPSISKFPKVAPPGSTGAPAGAPPPSLVPRADQVNVAQQARAAAKGSLQNQSVNRVHFPEAVALRRKRDQLQSKLRAIVERQEHARAEKELSESSSSGNKSTTAGAQPGTTQIVDEPSIRKATMTPSTKSTSSHITPLNHQLGSKKQIPKEAGIEILPPSALPNRRRTQWDAVLQEMSWLAADFIEERKWKLSSARTIATEISTSRRALDRSVTPGKGVKIDTNCATGSTNGNRDETEQEYLQRTSADNFENKGGVVGFKPSSADKNANGIVMRGYIDPDVDDKKDAKIRGRLISSMISELNSSIREGTAASNMGKSREEALKDFNVTRKLYLEQIRSFNSSPVPESGTNQKWSSTTGANERIANSDDPESVPDKKVEDSTVESITEAIDRLHKANKTRHKAPAKDFSNALRSSQKINLSANQNDMIDFVEKLWGAKPSCGVVFLGAPISGKTFVTAALLWKQRGKGPQILICPPQSVIRWRHEMNLFSNIRVLTFGLAGGIATPSFEDDVADVQDTDVIVCEYSCLDQMERTLSKRKLVAHSIVVDLRHPLARFRSVEVPSGATSTKDWNFPSELLAPEWWDTLILIMKPTNTRQLLIEHSGEDPLALSKSGIGDKEILEILANRAACIIGPDVFRSSTYTIHRQVLTWARHQRRKEIADKGARVRKALSDAIAPMCFYVRDPIVKSSDSEWKVRTCSMTVAQRQDYENCCREVRGALSSALVDEWNSASDSFSPGLLASSALLRLRHQCFHPDGHTILDNLLSRKRQGEELCSDERTTSTEQSKNVRGNSAQPDLDFANLLLRKSSKLKELISILKSEAGYRIDIEDTNLRSPVDSAENENTLEDGDRPKKVAILVGLSEAQQLVSLFLNSIGIQNDLMRRESLVGPGALEDICNEHQNSVVWAKRQTILSRFSDHMSDVDDTVTCSSNIIIASPSHLVGWNNGLGIEGADVIVSMDDDWTGRGAYMVNTLIRRSLSRSECVDKEIDLIRLVCADTIETNIFGTDVGMEESRNCPVDKDGYLTLPRSDDEALALLNDSMNVLASSFPPFPAVALMRQRGMLLSKVLATSEPLPKLLGSGAVVKFLPKRSSKKDRSINEENKAEVRFLRDFLLNELSVTSRTTESLSIGFSAQRSSVWKRTSPLWSNVGCGGFPIGLMTRQDLPAIATQMYLERISFSERVGLHLDAKAPPIHLSQLRDSTWDRGEVSSKLVTVDKPSTFLFYLPSEGKSEISMPASSTDDAKGAKAGIHENRRFNAYVKLFSGSHDGIFALDGSQGCEPLVFFPPLFPLLLESSKLAQLDRQDSSVTLGSTGPIEIRQKGEDRSVPHTESNATFKRKRIEPERETSSTDTPNSKRVKTLPESTHIDNGAAPADSLELGNSASISESPMKKSSPVADNSSESTVARMDVEPLTPKDSSSTPIAATSPLSRNGKGLDVSPLLADEDFGLLGIGAIASAADSASFSARNSRNNGAKFPPSYQYDYVTFPIPSDTEESDPYNLEQFASGLQTVLLFVKKNPVQSSDSQPLERRNHALPDTFWKGPRSIESAHAAPVAKAAVPSKGGIGDESGKKGKKRLSQGSLQLPPTAFTRLPGGTGVIVNRLVPKDSLTISKQSIKGDYKNRVLASFATRMRTTGMTMFDSHGYKTASIRVVRRVSERLERLMWKSTLTSQLGPGLPLRLGEDSLFSLSGQRETGPRWTNIVTELGPGAATGDAAISLSNSQLVAFKRSAVSPCRVDFGPFESGFLASPSGMNGVSSPRSRVGVSLPMGVKMIKYVREQTQSAWSSADDMLLQSTAQKFGMNWLLVASELSGFEGVVINEAVAGIDVALPAIARSARQCRERWLTLSRSQPSIADDARKAEKMFRENATGRPIQGSADDSVMKGGKCTVHTQQGVSFLSTSSLFSDSNLADETKARTQTSTDPGNNSTLLLQVNEDTESSEDVPLLNVENRDNKISAKFQDVEMSDAILPPELPRKTRSFSAISSAKLKRQIPHPLSIPGLISGSLPNHPVAPHPSHIQSVQASVTAQWASGRTEMWPLQILDLTDKHRSLARPAIAQQQRAPEKAVPNNGSSRLPVQNGAPQRPPQVAHPSANTGRPVASFPPIPSNANRQVPTHHRPPPPHVHQHISASTSEAYAPPQAAPAKAKNIEKTK